MHAPSSRRVFLASQAAGCIAAAVDARAGATPAATPTPAIDTHTHFYDPTRPEGVPWPAKGTPLHRRVLPPDWLAQAEPAGVTETIVVEASPWVEDNQWLLDVARNHPCVVGVVGRLPLGAEHCDTLIDRFAAQRKFRGVRVSGTAVLEGIDSAAFMHDVERLASHGLASDLNGGPVLVAADRLATRLPEMRVIVEHMAGARIAGERPDPAWLEGLARAAARPNVWLKVSNLVESAAHAAKLPRAPADPGIYGPWLDAAWQAFGPDRLIYGSNWPVCERAADYATVVGIVRPWITAHGPAAESSLFRAAAVRAYGL